jgi:hypothetical protein
MVPSNTTSFTLHSVLEKDKLTGTNFTNWIRNLRIVLRAKKREGVLGTPLPIDDNVKKSTGSSHLMAIQNKSIFKRKGNSSKKKGKAKDKIPMPNQAPKASPATKAECFHCKEIDHWKRNCKLYLASMKSKGSKGTSTLGTLNAYVTDIFLADSYNNSWVFDTGSVAHICNSMQGMIRSRSVERGEVDFRIGNNARFAALSVGTMQLHLPSGCILEMNNCYFVLSLS